jgi:hypothetical protein
MPENLVNENLPPTPLPKGSGSLLSLQESPLVTLAHISQTNFSSRIQFLNVSASSLTIFELGSTRFDEWTRLVRISFGYTGSGSGYQLELTLAKCSFPVGKELEDGSCRPTP